MTHGPGKYDDLCTEARERAEAAAVILMIIGGKKGSGFSVQANIEDSQAIMAALPALLRSTANQIEADNTPAGSA